MVQVRIEFRAIQVREFGANAHANLPVDRFGAVQGDHQPRTQSFDLLEILERLLKARLNSLDVWTPLLQQLPEESDETFAARQAQTRQALEIKQVVTDDRTLLLSLEWNTDAPRRILNLDSNSEYVAKQGDTGMHAATVAIYVPRGRRAAYIGVQQRSGVVSVPEPALQRWFREDSQVSDFRLHTAGFIPENFWSAFVQNGTVHEIQLERDRLPTDIVDLAEDPREAAEARDAGSVNVTINVDSRFRDAAKRYVIGAWDRVRNDTAPSGGYFLYEERSYEKLKVTMEYRGIQRTIVIGADPSSRLAPAFPVEVRPGPYGEPSEDELYKAIKDLIVDVLPSDSP